MGLGKQKIQKTAAGGAGAFDQLQIFRAKDDRAQDAEIIGQLAHGPSIKAQTAFLAGPIHFRFVFALADDLAADEISLLAVPDHLRAAHPAKRAERRDEINGFEDVGFALGVVTEKQVKTRREVSVQPRVIAEVAEP